MYIYYTFISNLSIDKSKKCINYYAFLDTTRDIFQNRLITKHSIGRDGFPGFKKIRRACFVSFQSKMDK